MADAAPVAEHLLLHATFVRTLARSLLSNPHDAEDVEQETWTAVLERPPVRDGDPRGWLARVTRTFAHHRRRGETRRMGHERAGARDEARPSFEESLVREEILRRVTDAVCALEEPYRSTILSRFFEDQLPAAIAAREQISVATVNTRLQRGLAKLRERLQNEQRDWRSALGLLAGQAPQLPGAHGKNVARRMPRRLKAALVAVALLLGWSAWIALEPSRPPSVSAFAAARLSSHDLSFEPDATTTPTTPSSREPAMPSTLLLASALSFLPSPPQCAPPPVDRWYPDPGTLVEFGLEVAISGEWAVVGAALDDSPSGVDAGAVYVYRRTASGWTPHSKLTADDAAAFDHFGIDVDIDGATIVVGARQHNHGSAYWPNAGAAYVFEFDSTQGLWSQSTELLGSNMQVSVIEFGSTVSVSGSTIVVSSLYDDASCGASGTECGAAYVYVEPSMGWDASSVTQETAELVSPTPENGAHFGTDVRIDGKTVVIGAHREDSCGVFDSGAVYVFEEPPSGWAAGSPIWARIVPEVPQAESGFGVRVDVQWNPLGGDRVAIGAHRYRAHGGRSAAFVVEEPPGGWASQVGDIQAAPNLVSREATFFPIQDTFGIGVALDGDLVVVGAPTDDPPRRPDIGRAYVFKRLSNGAWFEAQWLQADLHHSTGTYYPYMGAGLAIQGNTVLVGAHLDDNAAGLDAGTVLVYDLLPCFLRRR